jgi:lysozyme
MTDRGRQATLAEKGKPRGQLITMRVLLVLVAVLGLVSCGGSRQEPVASRATMHVPRFADLDPHQWDGIVPWQYPVHGIDVSKYQGDIDWHRVRAAGIDFAFIKATEGGDHADDRFLDNWRAARQAGMPRGAYHYYYFCRTAAEQAEWFIRNVPRDAGALPPVLDLEWTPRSRTCTHRPAPETVRDEARRFLQALTAHYGKRPIVYTTVDFYRDNDLGRMAGYHFWLRSVAGHPSIVYPAQRWAFWQYTGTGVVSGIDGPTDLNVFAGSPAQWRAWAAGG